MKLPSKLFSYKESIISKLPIILKEVNEKEYITISQLYISTIRKFDSAYEFLEALECLYVLKKIDYDYKLRRIRYAI